LLSFRLNARRKPLEQNKIYEFPFEISLKNNKEISLSHLAAKQVGRQQQQL
jgi:hypothetical protein